jgi:formylglycine-generating enzyme required for sulfatase activity
MVAGSDIKKMELQKKSKRWNLNIYQGDFPYKDIAEDGFAGTAPVMSYNADSHGIYDLAGNVWGWVATKGNKPNSYKIKGGSYLCGNHCQGFDPNAALDMQANESTDHIGFRCVD